MKIIILMIFLLISNITYSQIHYIEVNPKEEKKYEHTEGHFDNASGVVFFVNDYSKYKRCTISGYLSDPTLENGINIKTGWEYEYTEAKVSADSTGYFEATIMTDNLPNIFIAVYYMGEPVGLKLQNVDITFSGSRY